MFQMYAASSQAPTSERNIFFCFNVSDGGACDITSSFHLLLYSSNDINLDCSFQPPAPAIFTTCVNFDCFSGNDNGGDGAALTSATSTAASSLSSNHGDFSVSNRCDGAAPLTYVDGAARSATARATQHLRAKATTHNISYSSVTLRLR
jgi:hypothetical protein